MMKKFLFILFAVLLNVNAFSQNHLEFLGMPIDGELGNFVQKLESLGYELTEDGDDSVLMAGSFANENVSLLIIASKKTKIVYRVAVIFDKKDTWYGLESQYKDYKKLYTQKYGKPSKHYESFSSPYYEGDGYELQALKSDKCHYISTFKKDKSEIVLAISSSTCLTIIYQDGINAKMASAEEQSIAFEDI